MQSWNISRPIGAALLCGLLTACTLATPGMVGTPNGGVVQPYPWRNRTDAAAYRLAKRYCHSYHKRAVLVEWSDHGNSKFDCVY